MKEKGRWLTWLTVLIVATLEEVAAERLPNPLVRLPTQLERVWKWWWR